MSLATKPGISKAEYLTQGRSTESKSEFIPSSSISTLCEQPSFLDGRCWRSDFKTFIRIRLAFLNFRSLREFAESVLRAARFALRTAVSRNWMPCSRHNWMTLLVAAAALWAVAVDDAYADGKNNRFRPHKERTAKKPGGGILNRLFDGKNKRGGAGASSKQSPSSKENPAQTPSALPETRPEVPPIERKSDVSADGEVTAIEVDTDPPAPDGLDWSPSGKKFYEGPPSEGMLGLKDVIETAAENSVRLEQLRGAIKDAKANERAEHDWENPQFRFALDHDYDREVRRPYTTTEKRFIDSKGRDVTDRFQRNNNGSTERSREFQKQEGIEQRLIKETATPGPNGTQIDTTEFRKGSSSQTDSTDTRFDLPSDFSTASTTGSENSSNRDVIRESSFESNSFDPLAPDSGLRMRVRIPIPNFVQRPHRLEQAVLDISRVDNEFREERRKLVRDVTDAYERIEYLIALARFDALRLRQAEAYFDALKELAGSAPPSTAPETPQDPGDLTEAQKRFPWLLSPTRGGIGAVDLRRINTAEQAVFKAGGALYEAQGTIIIAKSKLAGLARIADWDRIVFTNTLVEREIDLENLNPSYLVAMAAVHRKDLGDLRFRLQISESELAEEKAKRIPVINFVDFDYSRSFEDSERSSDAFGVQISMSIPIADWFFNKSAAARRQERASLQARVDGAIKNISTEVEWAVKLVELHRENAENAAETVKEAKEMVERQIAALEASGQDLERIPEHRFDGQKILIEARQAEIKARRDFNQSIRDLEDAIGTGLDQIFGKEIILLK
jgi:outer membrane protein TolC